MEIATATTSSSSRRFRFRDHRQEMEAEDSTEAQLRSDTSSMSSDVELEYELTSMTGKGIGRLCSELLELKEASELDFRKSIFSSYSAFVGIFEEMGGMNTQLMQLKHHALTQKMLVTDFKNEIYRNIMLEETVESIIEEPLSIEPSPRSMLEIHTENVLDVLDTLLSEHKLDECLEVLEMEAGTSQNMQGSVPADVLMSYDTALSERRAMLADQYRLLAENPRVRAAELQKALVGLCRLGDSNVATQLLLKYYHLRISSGIYDMEFSETFSYGIHIRNVAKFVFSMISQAARSFVVLHGETSPRTSELISWAYEETEVFANCFIKCIRSISEISGRLSTAVEAVQFAMSYCSLLETQKLLLKPCLIEHIRPCMENVLQIHFDHLKKVMIIFTSTDSWVLGRYLLPGISTEERSVIFTQQPEYYLLTNSGRKFVTLLQAMKEDISSLVSLQMGGSILQHLMDLFTEYTVVLERSLNTEEYVEKGDSRINLAESLVQQVSVIANLLTLANIFPRIISSNFKEMTHLEFEMDSYISSTQENCSRLKANLCELFIHKVMSLEGEPGLASDNRIWNPDESDSSCNMMPSLPYQELFSELQKLEKLAEENLNEDCLVDQLRELVEAVFVWISHNEETWTIPKEELTDQYFKQFVVDIHFLVEIARSGRYLTNIMVNAFFNIISRMESTFVSATKIVNDYDWAVTAATEALQKLQDVEKTSHPDGSSDISEEVEEQNLQCLRDLLEDDDEAMSYSENSVESPEDSDIEDAPEVATDTETQISNGEVIARAGILEVEREASFDECNATHINILDTAVSTEKNIPTTEANFLEGITDLAVKNFVDRSFMQVNVSELVSFGTTKASTEEIPFEGLAEYALELVSGDTSKTSIEEVRTSRVRSER